MPAAVAIPSAISAGTSLIGGLIGSSAAKKAAAQQAAAAQGVAKSIQDSTAGAQKGMGEAEGIANNYLSDAAGRARDLYGNETQALSPYMQAGAQGTNSLAAAFAPGGSLTEQFHAPTAEEAAAMPGNQFQLAQGMKAVQRSAAANGGVNGGGVMKSLAQYGQGLASTNYQNLFNDSLQTFQTNRNNLLQGYTSLANLGLSATGQYLGATQNQNSLDAGIASGMSGNTMGAAQYSGNIGLQGTEAAGQALIGGANAQAAGTMGAANAWSGALGGVANAANYASLSSALSAPGSSPNFFMPYSQGRSGVPLTPMPGSGSPVSFGMPPVPSAAGIPNNLLSFLPQTPVTPTTAGL